MISKFVEPIKSGQDWNQALKVQLQYMPSLSFFSLIQKNDVIFFLLMLALPMSLEPLTDQQPSGLHEFEYCGQDV